MNQKLLKINQNLDLLKIVYIIKAFLTCYWLIKWNSSKIVKKMSLGGRGYPGKKCQKKHFCRNEKRSEKLKGNRKRTHAVAKVWWIVAKMSYIKIWNYIYFPSRLQREVRAMFCAWNKCCFVIYIFLIVVRFMNFDHARPRETTGGHRDQFLRIDFGPVFQICSSNKTARTSKASLACWMWIIRKRHPKHQFEHVPSSSRLIFASMIYNSMCIQFHVAKVTF